MISIADERINTICAICLDCGWSFQGLNDVLVMAMQHANEKQHSISVTSVASLIVRSQGNVTDDKAKCSQVGGNGRFGGNGTTISGG
jgi:hypothetical protein